MLYKLGFCTSYDLYNPAVLPILYNIVHTCLGYSKLNSHLMRNMYVRDDESCPCGFHKEDPDHFFMSCSLYTEIRNELVSSLQFLGGNQTINAKLLLVENKNLSYTQNTMIFNPAQKFILSSHRF